MKKRLFSAALLLMLMLSISVSAFATVAYPAPGPVEVGQNLDHLLATVSSESAVSAVEGTLPDGVGLAVVPKDTEKDIYLRGVPVTVGEYDCVIEVEGSGTLMCHVTVTPSVPVIQTGSSLVCAENDSAQISVSASVADGGSLSYQWYQSLTNSTAGGVAVTGANGDTLSVDTSEVGTLYYYCVVTNTSGGQYVSAESGVIAVTVEDLILESISVHALPAKTAYIVGDKLDASGLIIALNYHNGSSALVSEGFSVTPTKLDAAGEQTVNVGYGGMECSFTVTVEAPQEQIEGIGVLNRPSKTNYTVGEELNASGLSVRVYTNNGYRDVYTGLICTPILFETPGDQVVTVSYGGKTCTFTVNVAADVKPVSLAVSKLPVKTEYTVGDKLDVTGLTLRQTDSANAYTDITEGFTCEPELLDKAGQQEITVTYGALSCRFTVTVKEKEAASPSQPPQASDAPNSTEPIVEAGYFPKRSTAKTVMTLILFAAILALAGVLVYMLVGKRREDKAEKESRRTADEKQNFFDSFRKR